MIKIIKSLSMLALCLASGLLVSSCGGGSDGHAGSATPPGTVRTFYMAADEATWDYAPTGMNQITGEPFDDAANVFVGNVPFDPAVNSVTDARIGRRYTKVLYREYTDDTFTTLKPVLPEWQHLGALGPAIHAEVGDTIKVVFKNNSSFRSFSVHPHGVFYNKDSEGAAYNDGTSGADKADDFVPPGSMHTYTWPVPDRAGPGPMDGSSVMWMYHSHVDEPADENSGLIGPMIITRKGSARTDGTPTDVDREFVMLFKVYDENSSWYLDGNIQTYTGVADSASLDLLKADEDFEESNLMHSINGFVFGTLPGLTMKKGERVRWYLMSMGTEVDLHTPHWHGNTVLQSGMRTDVIDLLPASMATADMVPDNPGTWLFHCHVNDHISAGMMSLYTVSP